MPRFVPKPHHKQAKPEVTEVQVSTETKVAVQEQNVAQDTAPQSNVVMAGGFACPELAMGKVIIRRDDAAIIEQTATQQVNVEAQVTEAPAVIKEAPIAVETTKVETPVAEAPVVAKPVQSEEATPVVEPEVAVETPNAESVKVEEVPVVKAEAPKAAPKAVVAKKQAGSPMTKAPGPQEIKCRQRTKFDFTENTA
jgi:ribonuclease E